MPSPVGGPLLSCPAAFTLLGNNAGAVWERGWRHERVLTAVATNPRRAPWRWWLLWAAGPRTIGKRCSEVAGKCSLGGSQILVPAAEHFIINWLAVERHLVQVDERVGVLCCYEFAGLGRSVHAGHGAGQRTLG